MNTIVSSGKVDFRISKTGKNRRIGRPKAERRPARRASVRTPKFVSLKRYLKKRLLKIHDQLIDPALRTKSVHRLRLEIKKVDALFDLVHRQNKNFKPRKYFRSFKTLFKRAGKLRALQVEFDLLNTYFKGSSNAGYLHLLHQAKHKVRVRFKDYIQSGIRKDIDKSARAFIPYLNKIRAKDLEHYFRQEERRLDTLLEKKLFKEQELHFIRKKLKRFYLNVTNISPYKFNKRLHTMIELLGAWHDHQVAHDKLMKALYSGHLNEPETNALREILLGIRHDRDALLERIVSTYNSYTRKQDTD